MMGLGFRISCRIVTRPLLIIPPGKETAAVCETHACARKAKRVLDRFVEPRRLPEGDRNPDSDKYGGRKGAETDRQPGGISHFILGRSGQNGDAAESKRQNALPTDIRDRIKWSPRLADGRGGSGKEKGQREQKRRTEDFTACAGSPLVRCFRNRIRIP